VPVVWPELRLGMSHQPLRVAIIGMGGFAQSHHQTLLALEKAGACRVVCTCDPQPENFEAEQGKWQLAERNVQVYTDYVQMLETHAAQLDVVTVPTPIPLHAPMHRAIIERGLACYLEKPPTLNYAELEAMLDVEARAQWLTQVGFNFIVETTRQELKGRILNGEFGGVQKVGFLGFWPRPTTYFTRASWAGKLMLEGKLILDSCVGNAMAHYIHNLHFWCGQEGLFSWADLTSVEAELYRAHAIENFDTCFARGICTNGIEVHVAASHACEGKQYHREWIECEAAIITYVTHNNYHIAWRNGRTEEAPTDHRGLLLENFQHYFQYLRGEQPRPLTGLSDSRPFVHFNNLIYLAAQHITPVAASSITRSATPQGDGQWVAINGIQQALETFASTGQFPSEQGVEWGRAGGAATFKELPALASTVQQMRQQAQVS